MKKSKPVSLQQIQATTQSKIHKKSSLSTKKKPQKQSTTTTVIKKRSQTKGLIREQPQDYIIINDNIYSANTFTERNCYEQFLHKVKKEKQVQRKSFLVKSQLNDDSSQLGKSRDIKKKARFSKLSAKDFLQTMSLQQKKQMFFKLQQQIKSANGLIDQQYVDPLGKNSPPCSTQSFQNDLLSQRQRKQKFCVIEQKLETLKMQLMFKWQGQLDKMEQLCHKGKLTKQQKQTKSQIIEKLKDHKIKTLDCTKTLFEKILNEEEYQRQHNQDKTSKIEAILHSLHSFPSLESMDEIYMEKEPNIGHLKVKEKEKDKEEEILKPTLKQLNMGNEKKLIEGKFIASIDSSPLEIIEDNPHQTFLNQFNEIQHQRQPQPQQQYSKLMIREQLKYPLKFSTISPKKGKLPLFQDIGTITMNKQLANLPSRSQQILKQLLEGNFEEMHQTNQFPLASPPEKLSLKLDLRVDQVVFGQDEYPQCEKNEGKHDVIGELGLRFQEHYAKEEIRIIAEKRKRALLQYSEEKVVEEKGQLKDLKLQVIIKKESAASGEEVHEAKPESNAEFKTGIPSQVISTLPPIIQKISFSKPPKLLQPQYPQQTDLTCQQPSQQKMQINIPMLLSKQKMQTLSTEQNRTFRENLDKHIAFQMGCIQIQPSPTTPIHFTTLVDVNSYIVGLYEFMMKKYINSLVDNLNIPYGKSAVDKLYSLQAEGFVLEETYNDMNNILSESHFLEYQREIMLTIRKPTEFETSHNRALFNAFTKPYYELQGEVFPWIVSQKGITFYEITEDNIQEVFEKSKIKILENCTALCGIHPPSQIKNEQQSALITSKNEENLTKMTKTEILEQFDEWAIRYVNFDCLVRISVGKMIYEEVVSECVKEIQSILKKDLQT